GRGPRRSTSSQRQPLGSDHRLARARRRTILGSLLGLVLDILSGLLSLLAHSLAGFLGLIDGLVRCLFRLRGCVIDTFLDLVPGVCHRKTPAIQKTTSPVRAHPLTRQIAHQRWGELVLVPEAGPALLFRDSRLVEVSPERCRLACQRRHVLVRRPAEYNGAAR